MGFRFIKRIKIAPGLYLNVSTGGASISVGMPGAMINFGGKNGAKATIGIPGTGLSFQQNLLGREQGSIERCPKSLPIYDFRDIDIPVSDETMIPITSADVEAIGDMGITELELMINQSSIDRERLKSNLENIKIDKSKLERKIMFFGFFGLRSIFKNKLSSLEAKNVTLNSKISEINGEISDAGISFDWGGDENLLARYRAVCQSFGVMSNSHMIWDIVAFKETDKFKERSEADTTVSRSTVRFGMGRPDCLPASEKDEFKNVPHLENKNGGDLYIFPGFMLIESGGKFAAIPMSELKIRYSVTKFAETESVPNDSSVDGNTWLYANKNGGPDRRFKDNSPIPWAIYGRIEFRYLSVVHEEYMVSNEVAASKFAANLHGLIQEVSKNE
ncbi:DUF4236 domain-containing protein [Serratia entomophila]|uniref:DUF4236 domain-containing protein n=1 Tax=Serratia entomophila TaxID=42906 RepID=UPI00217ACC66|nr:DUF4236 domain-containing protein [Serratia entomophila]CAI0824946.1 Uncharacterised protein [Serratia entomophila]CAI1659877.1 Uncharacterised protein [Serratia entomophila]CAI1922697.1 Uncharacterised protein [Serratia entomophila]